MILGKELRSPSIIAVSNSVNTYAWIIETTEHETFATFRCSSIGDETDRKEWPTLSEALLHFATLIEAMERDGA